MRQRCENHLPHRAGQKRADHADTEDASHTAPEQLHKTYNSLHTTHSETGWNHEASLWTQKASGHKRN